MHLARILLFSVETDHLKKSLCGWCHNKAHQDFATKCKLKECEKWRVYRGKKGSKSEKEGEISRKKCLINNSIPRIYHGKKQSL